MSWARIGIALLVLALAAGTGYAVVRTYNSKIEEAARWKTEAEKERDAAAGWKAATDFWIREKEKADRVIAGRDREFAAVNRDVARLRDEREQAKRQDPTLQAWSDTPLPAFVVEQLRSVAVDPGSAERPKGRNPGKSSFWDLPATVSRADQR